jgi:hypothetical protein
LKSSRRIVVWFYKLGDKSQVGAGDEGAIERLLKTSNDQIPNLNILLLLRVANGYRESPIIPLCGGTPGDCVVLQRA